MTRTAMILPLIAVLAHPAAAQDLSRVQAAEQALRDVWLATPLALRDVALVTDVQGYGVYTPRADAVFASADTIVVYAAPVGYRWQAVDGGWRFGLEADLAVLSPQGETLLDLPDFGRAEMLSRVQNTEYHMVITLNLTSAPAGDYLLSLQLTDIVGGDSVQATIPFQIAP
jgi:hypothetical protein